MKKFLLILFLIPAFASVYGQCTFNNTLNSTITPPCPGSTTVACVQGGQYVAVNVTSGNTYTFTTCGNATWDTQITLFNGAGTTVLGFSDDACSLQSTVVWTSTLTGVVNVLIDAYPCTSNASCAGLAVTCSTVSSACVGGANNTCTTADPFCTGVNYNYCNTTGVGSLGTMGCLITSPNPMWMYLKIGTSGNLTITINQYNNSNVGVDVDFSAYGPYANLAAACPINGGTTPVSCSYSSSFTETVVITGAVAGQYYMLLITNYSNQAGYIQFSQTGGTGSTNCSILPIELIAFQGEALDGYNKISWKTATEKNNNYFKVERSLDGQSWKEINKVNGAGNSSTEKKYSVNDNSYSSVTNYYKLTQVDFNDNSTTSKIIAVDNSKNANAKLVKVVDVYGQQIVDENYNGIKIYCYDDGTYIKTVEINH
jgi:hypothetical protein